MVPSTDTFFLALQELNDATSDAIVSCISETLSKHGLELSNCTGLGSDGTNVMTGVHTGISAQLKDLQPSLISVHCVAHRLALVVIQASKMVS